LTVLFPGPIIPLLRCLRTVAPQYEVHVIAAATLFNNETADKCGRLMRAHPARDSAEQSGESGSHDQRGGMLKP
jgi:hypothetical protein